MRSAGLAAGLLAVVVHGCGAPPQPIVRASGRSWFEAALNDSAKARGHEWKEHHFPAADLHGPFPRPPLPDTTDANDPVAYYRIGLREMDSQYGLADHAFYWATRLNPYFAEAYYARWVLLRQRWSWRLRPDGTISYRDESAVAAADSLLLRATMYDPFVDEPMNFARLAPFFSVPGRRQRDPIINGAEAYFKRDYRRALELWGSVLRKDARSLFLRIPRAYAWVRLASPDSAIGELSQVVDRLETLQRDSVVAPYFSNERFHYSIGVLHARQNRPAEARAAFFRALQENLGFYMAHVRLAGVSLAERDTATAVNAMETALLIKPDDAFVAMSYGVLLMHVGRFADAKRWYETAIRADSDYALPQLYLGQLYDMQGDTLTAREHYMTYITHAARTAPDREWARARLRLNP
jgi:tetratricopeptide (TPR) repeat protein